MNKINKLRSKLLNSFYNNPRYNYQWSFRHKIGNNLELNIWGDIFPDLLLISNDKKITLRINFE